MHYDHLYSRYGALFGGRFADVQSATVAVDSDRGPQRPVCHAGKGRCCAFSASTPRSAEERRRGATAACQRTGNGFPRGF